jgi:hypothetical protein
MKKLLLLLPILFCAFAAHAQTVQCQASGGQWGPCPFVQPVLEAQAVNTKVSSGAGTTITNAFGANTTVGNSILCIAFESAAAAPVISDAQTNTYIVAASSATAPGYSVSIATNIAGGTTDTITETTTSGAASFSCHELKGGVSVGVSWDFVNAQQATSATLTFATQTATLPNELMLVAAALGGGTINATPGIGGSPSSLTTVDQSNTAVTGGAALSIVYSAHSNITTIPNFTQTMSLSASETYSAVLVAVKPVSIASSTTTQLTYIGNSPLSLYAPLFTTASATATQTSAAIRPPGLSGYGTLQLVWAGITGSPATCTVALSYQSSAASTSTATVSTIAVAPSNGAIDYFVNPSFATGDQMVATYSCGTYPTAGTLSASFAPRNIDMTEIQPNISVASFSASKSFAGSSTTDNAVLPGNASNTVLVTRVIVSCTATTAGIQTLSVLKRSAADTSGTSATFTVVPDDANYVAGVSAPLSYTGTGPSVGAAVGNVDTAQIGCNASATAGPNDVYILDRRLKPIVLRGTAQQLALNFGGAITGGTLTVTFEFMERP